MVGKNVEEIARLITNGPLPLTKIAEELDAIGILIDERYLESLSHRYSDMFRLEDGHLGLVEGIVPNSDLSNCSGAPELAPPRAAEQRIPEVEKTVEPPPPSIRQELQTKVDDSFERFASRIGGRPRVSLLVASSEDRRCIEFHVLASDGASLKGTPVTRTVVELEGAGDDLKKLQDQLTHISQRHLRGNDDLVGVIKFEVRDEVLESSLIGLARSWDAWVLFEELLGVVGRPALGLPVTQVCQEHLPPTCDHRSGVECLERVTRELLDELRGDPTETTKRVITQLARWDHPLVRGLTTVSTDKEETGELYRSIPPNPNVNDLDTEPSASEREAADSYRQLVRLFHEHLPAQGREVRTAQVTMALASYHAMRGQARMAIEAPTGTGKSLAYLAAGSVWVDSAPQAAVVIATHTKLLQRQLRHEVEALHRALGAYDGPRVRFISGTSNYICARESSSIQPLKDDARGVPVALAVGLRALSQSHTGTWDDIADEYLRRNLPGYEHARQQQTTSSAACERDRCEFASICPLRNALVGIRERPGIIVTNHALIASWFDRDHEAFDLDESSGPDIEQVGPLLEQDLHLILDEAHELEDSLSAAWSTSFDQVALTRTLQRARRACDAILEEGSSRAGGARTGGGSSLLTATSDLRSTLTSIEELVDRLGELAGEVLAVYGPSARSVAINEILKRTNQKWRLLQHELDSLKVALHELMAPLRSCLDGIDLELRSVENTPVKPHSSHARIVRRASRLLNTVAIELAKVHQPAARAVSETNGTVDAIAVLHLVEDEYSRQLSWSFQVTPLDIDMRFPAQIVKRTTSTILTSATLRTEENFEFLSTVLGVEVTPAEIDPHHPHSERYDADLARTITGAGTGFVGVALPSPFDFSENALTIFTGHLSPPSPGLERQLIEDLAEEYIGFTTLAGGRTLGLFTSARRLAGVRALMEPREAELAERFDVEYLFQRRENLAFIQERFREVESSVALGLRSFATGFDVPGASLTFLMIERPHFPPPNDPIISARQARLRDFGKDGFFDYVLPRTTLSFVQAVGRLIRTSSDRGVVMVLDRRLQVPGRTSSALRNSMPIGMNVIDTATRAEAWREAIGFVGGDLDALELHLKEFDLDPNAELAQFVLEEGEDPTDKLVGAAWRFFGIEQLAPEQLELMKAVLAGRDAVGILPTGFGKSICFQLPALLHPRQLPTIVVSPLNALIKDQIDELVGRLGLRGIRALTGSSSATERQTYLQELREGRLRLLYLSPERLVRDPALHEALKRIEIGALTMDEAHCISSWGHDFRPEFRQIAPAVAALPRSPRLALTATANELVEQDIIDTLLLDDPVRVRAPSIRANLSYARISVQGSNGRIAQLLRLIGFHQSEDDRIGIVYVQRREETEYLAAILNRLGYRARAFHAGLIPEIKEGVQEAFFLGTTDIVVATKAFGMGINKRDVGWVIHYGTPESLDAYSQESGRAARDKSIDGLATLIWSNSDISRRWRQLDLSRRESDAITRAERILQTILSAPQRGSRYLLREDELPESDDENENNVILAWLARADVLKLHPDSMGRVALSKGFALPRTPKKEIEFREIVSRLDLRPGKRRLLSIDDIATKLHMEASEVEALLSDLAHERLLDVTTTERLRTIEIIRTSVPRQRLTQLLRDWNREQRARFEEMVGYTSTRGCLRASIAAAFDSDPPTCRESVTAKLYCDTCRGEPRPWTAIDLATVPLPEEVFDYDSTIHGIVRWNGRRTYPVSEANLIGILLGIGGRFQSHREGESSYFGLYHDVPNAKSILEKHVRGLVSTNAVLRQSVSFEDKDGRQVSYPTLLPISPSEKVE